MADIDLKTATPDTSLPSTGFLFGADSQSAASPSVYSTQAFATTLLGSTSLTGDTLTADAPVLNMSQTWNNSGVTFTGLKFNVATDTASAAASLLMDLQVGGSSKFTVGKTGNITTTGGILVADGSASAPTYSFSSRSTTGFYSTATDRISVATGGIERYVFLGGDLYLNTVTGSLRFGTAGDVLLGRRAAANLRLGAADAASPVAQTLSVQSVVAGTSNTAGANLTITGSQGTGTGAGGSIVFQVAPAGSSGTAVNALATALTIDSTSRASFTTAAGAGTYINDGGAGLIGFYAASVRRSYIWGQSTGQLDFAATNGQQMTFTGTTAGGFKFDTNGAAFIYTDAAETFALRNGANAQELRLYGSYTSTTNYQRLSVKTLRESSGALSGATYVSTIAIPAYAHLIGVTTRVTTAVTGATSYSVGDGTTATLWGNSIGVTLGSQSRTADFTSVNAVGAAATSRTVTLTANGSNFTGGVIEICLHYLTTEAD